MSKKDDDKVFAFLGAFIPIIGFIIVLLAKKDSKLAMYHAKQGLVLGIVAIIVSVIASIFVRGFLFFGFFGIIFSLRFFCFFNLIENYQKEIKQILFDHLNEHLVLT